jgi:hypothetical protein
MNINDQLVDLANTLPDGGRDRFVCPSCGGGSTSERSLSITKEGLGAHCRCYRANCRLGYKRVLANGTVRGNQRVSHPLRREGWDDVTVPLSEMMESQFNLNFYDTDVPLRVTDDGRVVIPILDSSGVRRGDVVRQDKPYDKSKPKALSLFEAEYDGMSWFYPLYESHPSKEIICLVEDSLSAMRLAQRGIVGVALLGVSLDERKVATLVARGGVVHLALDADAHLVAVRQAQRLRNRLDLRVHRLYHDVKDMSRPDLRKFIEELEL